MYDVVIEKTPNGEARVMFAILRDLKTNDYVLADILSNVISALGCEYEIRTAEAIALGNLTTTGE